MHRGREGRDDFYGGFGSHRSMTPSLYGERDPFEDPFFTRPFGSLFDSGRFGSSAATSGKDQTSGATRTVKEELTSDDEGLNEDTDETESKSLIYGNDRSKVGGEHSQASRVGVQTCRVTYGGVDGAYYTSTRTTKAGTDGVVVEETKEADRTTGQAKHRISRGIHDKGHSFTRKLNSYGDVDTLETLHNLNEDELAGFEEAWKGNAKGNLYDGEDGFHMHGNAGSSSSKQKKTGWGGGALPSVEHYWKDGGMGPGNEGWNNFSPGGTKNVVRINIE